MLEQRYRIGPLRHMAGTYVRQAEPSLLNKAQVFALAESVAAQLGFSPGDDIGELVRRIGGSIRVEDTLSQDPERSGSLFVNAPGNFTIVVSAHTSALRDNFTVAHELGHYYVHYLWKNSRDGAPGGTMMALRKGSDRVEWEANWFAGAFLMPKAAFVAIYRRCAGALTAVAKDFSVSPKAAEVRAKQLGLA